MRRKHTAPQHDLPGTEQAFNLAGETGAEHRHCAQCGAAITPGGSFCDDCSREHRRQIEQRTPNLFETQ